VPEGDAIPPFYISRTVLLQVELDAMRQQAPEGAGERPAVGVSFEEALAYCRWYAELSGKTFRLPTPREWEHACRAETHTGCFWGDDPELADGFAWHAGNSGGTLPSVEGKKANRFGLFDMLGTVWEWTDAGPGSEPRAIAMGGSFLTPASDLRADIRNPFDPATRRPDLGFRIVRSLNS
jgi:formylglycine-generating enzyme required for sulfatase activity